MTALVHKYQRIRCRTDVKLLSRFADAILCSDCVALVLKYADGHSLRQTKRLMGIDVSSFCLLIYSDRLFRLSNIDCH